ncbi:MAG: MBL fold metallo-hydrolase, partial [bacterium]|nr:MBL fold metallo-hydrolase [bacterium]
MIRTLALGALCVVSATFGGQAQATERDSCRVIHPTDRITCLSPGTAASPNTSCVIEDSSGLLVVDTGLSSTMASATRARIVAEIGREDFRYVINTHGHFDHVGGNESYSDALIIGHENVLDRMRTFIAGHESWIERRLVWLESQKVDLAGAPADSEEVKALAETLSFNHSLIEDLRNGRYPTTPALTFSDRLTLHGNDISIQLYSFGKAHTEGDLVIHVPELKTLFTGDLFFDYALGVLAGGTELDVRRWIEVLDSVGLDNGGVETVIAGHGRVFSHEFLSAQHRYLSESWQAATKARTEGLSFREFMDQFPFDERFSFVAEQLTLTPEDITAQHMRNLETMWRVGLIPTANEIGSAARGAGAEAVVERWAEIRGDNAFYVDESEINALGYQLLRDEHRIPEALAVFKINTEAFPKSWNAWDSFAEAHWWIDDQVSVERYYRKALELNPQAESARAAISQIEGHRLDAARETNTLVIHQPGQPTGLDGPYFGQEPPGLVPEIFAPGIVSSAEGFEFSISFTPDGREVYFTRRLEPDGGNTLMVSRWRENGWTAPEPAPFAQGFQANEPHVSPDGSKIFFGSRPPEGEPPGPGIWVADREDDGWGEPRFHKGGMFVSTTRNGDLYAFSMSIDGRRGIVRHPRDGEGYGLPVLLGGGVNEPKGGVHGWIDPDERFIVFDSYGRLDAQGGEGDLFVAFRAPDGGFGEAINLGDDVNTPATNFCPALSPDGKYLFYATYRDIYWVSADVM